MLDIFKKQFTGDITLQRVLKNVYGLNNSKISQILIRFNLPFKVLLKNISNSEKLLISDLIKSKFFIENTLKKIRSENLTKQIKSGSIRGFRNKMGLPVRGQRTHSNGRTKKKFKKVKG